MQIFNEDFYLKKTILVILALILSTQSSFAIEDIKKVDIKQAIEIARENNLDILSSRMNVDIAKNDIKSANRLQNPEIKSVLLFWTCRQGKSAANRRNRAYRTRQTRSKEKSLPKAI